MTSAETSTERTDVIGDILLFVETSSRLVHGHCFVCCISIVVIEEGLILITLYGVLVCVMIVECTALKL